ncbi:DNA-binding transcriptional response regulator, NtrC family, contains REC, AAA-type ATPase, and a Fis-type DNA-binding domains [Geoalkalibacter ferrihydriticus]|uniref:Chemotaxis protein CheY n=2 Tax=Geoalkalibacter ferrihydriticus TaxID=392333 RepID=A0A0C2HSV9_9BACT|nr:sigma-54 dependent transcriptional regulator [Geoalkalibacter ferrihydriticus]KIH75867.1 chemotaxis protein CheY [Geoalkalibacter ferrihydriticus DSM 17813]SDM85771.1 DNA-binding transcriptional response regulator, NtrC family, contains REC, AAA-type ATPase, and a Fis-type DNA-binding domains [Geoalkalibacter ferrihydriticus]
MAAQEKGTILIVDDEPNALKVLAAIMGEEGYRVVTAGSVEAALPRFKEIDFDAVITDMKMPGLSGMDLFGILANEHPDIPVIFLTAYGSVESAVEAMTRGAFYYFIKPPDYLNLKGILSRAVEQRRLKRELFELKKRLNDERKEFRLIGSDPEVRKILDIVDAVRDSESSVLICGETGTGKEMIARSLHCGGTWAKKNFVAVNCAAIPRELIESELFGYEKGAFTGASARRIGRVEQAAGGTLFLDEIGELDLSVQAKLLRVLQEKEIERLGSNEKISVHFRLVSSTNRDLLAEIKMGRFRQDLYYRLNVVQVTVPPLRERRPDIPLLVAEFLREFCAREGKVLSVSDEAMDIMQSYAWPGNIRQLRNVVERAVVLARGQEIGPRALPAELLGANDNSIPSGAVKTMRERELAAVKEALERCAGNKSEAARSLGISRKALYKRLNDYGLS